MVSPHISKYLLRRSSDVKQQYDMKKWNVTSTICMVCFVFHLVQLGFIDRVILFNVSVNLILIRTTVWDYIWMFYVSRDPCDPTKVFQKPACLNESLQSGHFWFYHSAGPLVWKCKCQPFLPQRTIEYIWWHHSSNLWSQLEPIQKSKQIPQLFKECNFSCLPGFAHWRIHDSKNIFDGMEGNLLIIESSGVGFLRSSKKNEFIWCMLQNGKYFLPVFSLPWDHD